MLSFQQKLKLEIMFVDHIFVCVVGLGWNSRDFVKSLYFLKVRNIVS